ncbi:hypothetical protein [Methylocella sp.]|uniref:hypothetical protein n=1 Tax=Methylocella sp. TaxID=1978226 RepID=UPI0035B29518
MQVGWKFGRGPEAGQHFSLGRRLHRVVAVTPTGDGLAEIVIRPWLREAQPLMARLDFDDPACLCRLEKDDGMSLDLDLWKFASPSVSFVEAF